MPSGPLRTSAPTWAAHQAASSSGRSLSVQTAKARAGGSSSRVGSRNAQNSLPSTSASVSRCGCGHLPLAGEYSASTRAPRSSSGSTRGRRRRDGPGSSRFWRGSAGETTEVRAATVRRERLPRILERLMGRQHRPAGDPRLTVTPTPCHGRSAARTPNGQPPPPGDGSSEFPAPIPTLGWQGR